MHCSAELELKSSVVLQACIKANKVTQYRASEPSLNAALLNRGVTLHGPTITLHSSVQYVIHNVFNIQNMFNIHNMIHIQSSNKD